MEILSDENVAWICATKPWNIQSPSVTHMQSLTKNIWYKKMRKKPMSCHVSDIKPKWGKGYYSKSTLWNILSFTQIIRFQLQQHNRNQSAEKEKTNPQKIIIYWHKTRPENRTKGAELETNEDQIELYIKLSVSFSAHSISTRHRSIVIWLFHRRGFILQSSC